jgi:hypothetical protein
MLLSQASWVLASAQVLRAGLHVSTLRYEPEQAR